MFGLDPLFLRHRPSPVVFGKAALPSLERDTPRLNVYNPSWVCSSGSASRFLFAPGSAALSLPVGIYSMAKPSCFVRLSKSICSHK